MDGKHPRDHATQKTPSATPLGECVVTWWTNPATDEQVLRIDRADRHIKVTDELLSALIKRGWAGEGLFRIEAKNGSVTYALGEQDEIEGVWTATRRTPWPSDNPP